MTEHLEKLEALAEAHFKRHGELALKEALMTAVLHALGQKTDDEKFRELIGAALELE